jgi:hypothetical protein
LEFPDNDLQPEIAQVPAPTQVAELAPVEEPPSPPIVTGSLKAEPDLADIPSPARLPSARPDLALPPAEAKPQTPVATPVPVPIPGKRPLRQYAHNKAEAPRSNGRTAVYDIAAQTVYLPNGDRLEAHSGLGEKMDNPRYVHVKNRGPTPPNIYDLTLRERLFHGVQAVRLNPVHESKMFGRDGMLAHTYMLGPNGQSNGCVSFKDYPKFLRAFMRGEIDRLVVVADLDGASWRVAAARGARRYADNNP